MTNSEAIKTLTVILEEATAYEYSVSYVTDEDAEALQMAIEALEKTSGCKGCKQTQIHCFDCARKALDFYKGEEDE